MLVATNVINTINESLERDGGARYRKWLSRVVPHMSDAYSPKESGFRTHMGASVIGKECEREIWYSFRWYKKSSLDGRMLRLVNRGHLEEARFIALLLSIGVKVYQQDENGRQFKFSHAGGHIGGSGDGVALNLPDYPDVPVLLEFKTANDKSFRDTFTRGVMLSKPVYFTQMQVLMYKMGLKMALFMMVNKNDDYIHAEWVPLNEHVAIKALERAERIVFSGEEPKRISENASYWKCKFCDFRDICHGSGKIEENCRSCQESEPMSNGEWKCHLYDVVLDDNKQSKGCENWK